MWSAALEVNTTDQSNPTDVSGSFALYGVNGELAMDFDLNIGDQKGSRGFCWLKTLAHVTGLNQLKLRVRLTGQPSPYLRGKVR